jgi:hypothetical protein
VDEVLSSCETLVIGNSSGEFRAAQARIRPGQTVVDLVRAFTGVPDGATYIGLCW